jgi:2-methylisocitrate lyase-like PEP mutase family enzyme
MTTSSADTSAKRQAFRRLHDSGCFVLPNPWDKGGSRYLQGLGFKALATTSAGYAWSIGRADGGLNLQTVLEHMREMVEATDLPVNGDFEHGFSEDLQGLTENVRLAIETGVAGISIEDSTGDPESPLFDLETAVTRIKAARAAIDKTGGETLLIGRAENFFIGRPDIADTLARLRAYAEAGADCLYAPGISTREQIVAAVQAVAPRPFNLLIGSTSALTVKDIAELGVRRISVGAALSTAAWGGFMRAARSISEKGVFDGFADNASGKQLNNFFTLTSPTDTVKRKAKITGNVEYREGDGPMLTIPLGLADVETTPSDATLSWADGPSRGAAAIPVANFCQYIFEGSIAIVG